ncbi:type VI secretion protein, EvpB/VC_A0108 family [Desulfonatronospira thiodismutans ASO3-1]|uniref:Type VI secretion protein, EvpB/VC_A0108 family n=1 Tax=Desulfonatronospira thiodismutans ASO3-1 TaxID=555779 RepID=D6SPQ4_9BACT|nr:type VI secretion system contractile sheath large subunit [Desulfonatronospira thiodismutans]EFI34730.1 type VI secretion protein, EvpB/VC_A0108 family [Desulfonatronospira thiodismutans ASO3-1]
MAEEKQQAEKTEEQTQEAIDLKRFLSSMRLSTEVSEPVPMVQDGLSSVQENISDEDRFISGLAALLMNVDPSTGRFDKALIQDIVAQIDEMVNSQLNEIIHHDNFKQVESNWRSLNDLIQNTNFKANVMIDILDVSKDELFEDFESNAVDITGSALFKKVYVSEYDQFGGKPFGGIIGLYEFTHTPQDEFWLKTMGKVAAASHAPFLSSVSPSFFGCDSIEELAGIKDLEGLMNHPKYGSWNQLRDSEEAAYLGLTLPRYIVRLPYDPAKNPTGDLNFYEDVKGDNNEDYLWGSSAILFAQNMVRSFVQSGWCQYLRGPKGGGLVTGLPVHAFNIRGEEEIKVPVEMVVPDYRELEFANAGFIPLVYRKGSAEAAFFSAQSLKKAKKFKDPKDTENSQLVTNLSYTFSVTRVAHYVKSIMRDNIGTSADAAYIKQALEKWIFKYVTTVVNPDDLTLRNYPFKAATVDVVPREGMIGWYDCSISILPHIQFEGMDVELKLDARL